MIRQTLSKAERLYHRKLFEELLSSKNSFVKYPLRVVYKESSTPGEFPIRIAISVGKKRFKRANKRNRIKRLIREAYRLYKPTIIPLIEGKFFDILFIYIDNKLPDFRTVNKSVQILMNKIIESEQ
ncbi:MAG: ribonuclease P protein component [Bacteroidales bacterium]|nr:ribonuclease P protein component [Bacteroidales bacterium]